jgi:hypothetical protein
MPIESVVHISAIRSQQKACKTHLRNHERDWRVILVPMDLVLDILKRTRDIISVIVRHDMGMHKVAQREDLLAHGTEARSLARGIVATEDPRAVPVFADANWDAVGFHGCSEGRELADEGVPVVHVSDGLGAELDAVKDVGRNVRVGAI